MEEKDLLGYSSGQLTDTQEGLRMNMGKSNLL